MGKKWSFWNELLDSRPRKTEQSWTVYFYARNLARTRITRRRACIDSFGDIRTGTEVDYDGRRTRSSEFVGDIFGEVRQDQVRTGTFDG